MNPDAESAAVEPVDPYAGRGTRDDRADADHAHAAHADLADRAGQPAGAARMTQAGHTGAGGEAAGSRGAARSAARRQEWRAQAPVIAVIAVGGAAGALARYEAGLIWPTATGHFPWTTFLVNAIGCLVIGAFLVVVTEIRAGHRLLRPFVGTGILGGFTTFSTFCVDIARLVDTGRAPTALAYLAGTALTALCAVTVGAWGTRSLLRKWRTP